MTQSKCVDIVEMADLADALMSSGRIVEGLASLIDGLGEARVSMPSEDWKDLCSYLRAEHPVREKLYQDPMTRRVRHGQAAG
jgi:hypothetical protein